MGAAVCVVLSVAADVVAVVVATVVVVVVVVVVAVVVSLRTWQLQGVRYFAGSAQWMPGAQVERQAAQPLFFA